MTQQADLFGQEEDDLKVEATWSDISEPLIKDSPLPAGAPTGTSLLFDGADDGRWVHEWKGMPEFIMDDLESWKQLIVHFESWKDLEAFAKLVDQKLTFDTKSIWYPKMENESFMDKRYNDEP